MPKNNIHEDQQNLYYIIMYFSIYILKYSMKKINEDNTFFNIVNIDIESKKKNIAVNIHLYFKFGFTPALRLEAK